MDDRWGELALELGGSFAARVRGLISPELLLLSGRNEPFGRLRADDAGGARLEAGGLTATLETSPSGGYAMMAGDAEILTAEPAGSATVLRLNSENRTYEAGLSPLRNNATAHSSDGREAARVSGGLAGRRYEATFDPADPAALPIAVFLLQHLTQLRGRAYRT